MIYLYIVGSLFLAGLFFFLGYWLGARDMLVSLKSSNVSPLVGTTESSNLHDS